MRSLADFEVIEIIDDSTLYPVLLGINWAFNNQVIINLKKKTMSFKGNGIWVIGPLDPALGPRYKKLIIAEEEACNIDVVYQLTTAQGDYVNPTNDGMLNWHCESSCISDLEVGLENWKQCIHEVSRRRLARITKSLRWIGSEVSTLPIFDGLSDIHIFVQEYEVQVPYSKRLQSLVVALRATSTRWWTGHQGKITTWESCRKLLMIRFGTDTRGMDSLYDGVTCPIPHIQTCEEAWKDSSNDEWVNLFVHTLDSNPRHWCYRRKIHPQLERRTHWLKNIFLYVKLGQHANFMVD